MVLVRARAPFRIFGDYRRQLKVWRDPYERCVERRTGEAVSDEPDAQRWTVRRTPDHRSLHRRG
jgi:hypothetical protein